MKAIKYFFIRWYYKIFNDKKIVKLLIEEPQWVKYGYILTGVSGMQLKFIGDGYYIILDNQQR